MIRIWQFCLGGPVAGTTLTHDENHFRGNLAQGENLICLHHLHTDMNTLCWFGFVVSVILIAL